MSISRATYRPPYYTFVLKQFIIFWHYLYGCEKKNAVLAATAKLIPAAKISRKIIIIVSQGRHNEADVSFQQTVYIIKL